MNANPILLQRKYARIVELVAKHLNLPFEQVLDLFYNSTTFELVSEGVADLHCRSDEYLAEELEREIRSQNAPIPRGNAVACPDPDGGPSARHGDSDAPPPTICSSLPPSLAPGNPSKKG